MEPNQIQNLESNQQHIVATYTTSTNTIQNIPNLNQPLLSINNPQISETKIETKEIIKNEYGSKTIQEIQEKKHEINSVPFKSMMQIEENLNCQEMPPFSSKYIIKQNNLFNNTNPFAKNLNLNKNSKKRQSATIQNEIKQPKIYHTNKVDRYFEKKVKSHNIRNSINEKIFENKSVFKIQTFKSKAKQGGRLTTFDKNTFESKNVLELNKINEENEKYILLIKRISLQLKKKVRPPTQGFFYKIIKNEQYKLLVKRIAFQLKRRTRVPTPRYSYKYIRNEEYKLLIKRIAYQLKRKIREPSLLMII